MKISTANWVHRTIRRQDRFSDARDDPSLAHEYSWASPRIIGVYRNPPKVSPQEIVVTETGLVSCDGDARIQVPFEDIEGIERPEKGAGGRLRLVLRDGREIDLAVAGSDSRFEDVWEFLRFLNRVVEQRSAPRESPSDDDSRR